MDKSLKRCRIEFREFVAAGFPKCFCEYFCLEHLRLIRCKPSDLPPLWCEDGAPISAEFKEDAPIGKEQW